MSDRFDFGTLGAPHGEHRHHGLREFAAVIAAVSGGMAALVVGYFIVGGAGARGEAWAWAVLTVLVLVWLTGLWWRWDSPDKRKKTDERERRGF